MYTVKQLSRLAGVTPRTLHHYDAIGLLKPSRVGDNGYRYYEEEALLRLQQILLDVQEIKSFLCFACGEKKLQILHGHRRNLTPDEIEQLPA